MSFCSCKEIARWFLETHSEWVENGRLISWAGKLGIKLRKNNVLDEDQLFHLFVLAILWNNDPTYRVELGEQVFKKIKNAYTLENFRKAAEDVSIGEWLKTILYKAIPGEKAISEEKALKIFNLLMFVVNGKFEEKNVWKRIKHILEFPIIGNREDDIGRLKQLYEIFNSISRREYAYFTVKTFLVFREIRIQFRDTGEYQYHPAICCVPDSRVKEAVKKLNLVNKVGNDINSLIRISQTVAKYFCTKEYELYDLPLFYGIKEKRILDINFPADK